MSTNSNRSSGTQHNKKGVTQGVTLVDPKTGFPVEVIQDSDGKYRLAVDAKITAQIGDVNVHLSGTGTDGDNLYLVDNATGNKLKINSDGTIDVNTIISASSGDNIAISDGTNTAEVNSNKELKVKDTDVNTSLGTLHLDNVSIESKQDTANTHLSNLEGYVDGLEALGTSTNSKLDTTNTQLSAINANTDGLESLITSANSLLTTIRDNADQVETLLTNINNNTDQVETLIATTNSLITASNTLLTAIGNNTDGLENLVSSTNNKLDAINTHLSTIEGYVDGLETLIISTNTKLDTLHSDNINIDSKLDTANINLTNLKTELDTVNYTMNESFNKAQAIAGQLDDVSTTIATEDNVAPIRITTQRAAHINLRNTSGTEIGTLVNPLITSVIDGQKNTYFASGTVTAAQSATDIITITGSASKVVRITRVAIAAAQSTGTIGLVTLMRRSSANSGGTSSTLSTLVSADSINPAPTATIRTYTANPTALGTFVGTIRSRLLSIGALVSANNNPLTPDDFIVDFGTRGTQAVVLRGTTQLLTVNLGGTNTYSGNIFAFSIEWTEE
jgi:ABC-type transporter Mla subunit MlaD